MHELGIPGRTGQAYAIVSHGTGRSRNECAMPATSRVERVVVSVISI